MRRTNQRAAGAASVALAVALGGITPAFADTLVSNDVATGGDTTLAAGATGKARFHLVATDGASGTPDRDGCNATVDKPVTVTLSSSNVAVVELPTPAPTLSITGCDNPLTTEIENAKEYAYSVLSTASKDATTTITGTATGGLSSSKYTSDGFVVKVAAPSDTTKPTASHTITAGANSAGWFKTSPVTVEIEGNDETLLHSIDYTLNGASATVLAAGGVKTAKVPVTASADRRHTMSYTAKDGAGNVSATGTVDFGIDTVAPSLSGAPSQTGINADGWYKAPVAVKWTASDGTSGLAAGVPADSTISGEGRGKTAGTSVSDNAGHSTQVTSTPGVNIDGTAPSINGEVIKSATDRTARPVDGTSPDGKGWYSSPALVGFTCEDPRLADGTNATLGSGVASCSDPEAVTTNGAGQSVSGSTKDIAGNTRSGTASGINVDMDAPTTTSELTCGSTTWCKTTVSVTLTASDVTELASGSKTELSGVKQIRYSTDGGTNWQTTNGASKTLTIPLNGQAERP